MNDSIKNLIDKGASPDDIAKLINKGIQTGQAHSDPAPATLDFMEKTREKISNINTSMAGIETNLDYIKKSLDKNEIQHKELGDKIDHLSTTFQNKWEDKADQKIVMDEFTNIKKNYAEKIDENDSRVKKIENWKNKIIGALIVMNIIILPIVYIFLSNWLSKK